MDASLPASPSPIAALSDTLAGIVEAAGASAWAVLGPGGRGGHRGRPGQAIASAVVWRDGVLVTAAHVFRRTPAAISVVAPDGQTHDAVLIGLDASTDVAAYRLPETVVATSARVGEAAALRAGHLVIAVGRAAGGDTLASYGMVNRSGGPWQSWLGGQLDRMVRLDGGVYDGLSGAPVVDAEGPVVGIATAALSRSHGIVVPASTVARVVDALLAKGRVARAFLGISGQPVTLPANDYGEGAVQGLLIAGVAADGPAAAAGVLIGDVLLEVGGEPAAALQELRSALADRIGERVRVRLVRGGQPLEVDLTLAEWPQVRRCG